MRSQRNIAKYIFFLVVLGVSYIGPPYFGDYTSKLQGRSVVRSVAPLASSSSNSSSNSNSNSRKPLLFGTGSTQQHHQSQSRSQTGLSVLYDEAFARMGLVSVHGDLPVSLLDTRYESVQQYNHWLCVLEGINKHAMVMKAYRRLEQKTGECTASSSSSSSQITTTTTTATTAVSVCSWENTVELVRDLLSKVRHVIEDECIDVINGAPYTLLASFVLEVVATNHPNDTTTTTTEQHSSRPLFLALPSSQQQQQHKPNHNHERVAEVAARQHDGDSLVCFLYDNDKNGKFSFLSLDLYKCFRNALTRNPPPRDLNDVFVRSSSLVSNNNNHERTTTTTTGNDNEDPNDTDPLRLIAGAAKDSDDYLRNLPFPKYYYNAALDNNTTTAESLATAVRQRIHDQSDYYYPPASAVPLSKATKMRDRYSQRLTPDEANNWMVMRSRFGVPTLHYHNTSAVLYNEYRKSLFMNFANRMFLDRYVDFDQFTSKFPWKLFKLNSNSSRRVLLEGKSFQSFCSLASNNSLATPSSQTKTTCPKKFQVRQIHNLPEGDHIAFFGVFAGNFAHTTMDHLPTIARIREYMAHNNNNNNTKLILFDDDRGVIRKYLEMIDPGFVAHRVVWLKSNHEIRIGGGGGTIRYKNGNTKSRNLLYINALRKWIWEKESSNRKNNEDGGNYSKSSYILYLSRRSKTVQNSRVMDSSTEADLLDIIKRLMKIHNRRPEELVVFNGEMALREQYELFRSADTVIGGHGGAFANTIWMGDLLRNGASEKKPQVLEFLIGPMSQRVQPEKKPRGHNFRKTYYYLYDSAPWVDYHHVLYSPDSTHLKTFINLTDFEQALASIWGTTTAAVP